MLGARYFGPRFGPFCDQLGGGDGGGRGRPRESRLAAGAATRTGAAVALGNPAARRTSDCAAGRPLNCACPVRDDAQRPARIAPRHLMRIMDRPRPGPARPPELGSSCGGRCESRPLALALNRRAEWPAGRPASVQSLLVSLSLLLLSLWLLWLLLSLSLSLSLLFWISMPGFGEQLVAFRPTCYIRK
jgi:hypothetical protein